MSNKKDINATSEPIQILYERNNFEKNVKYKGSGEIQFKSGFYYSLAFLFVQDLSHYFDSFENNNKSFGTCNYNK